MLLLVLMSYAIFIYILFCCRLVMRYCVACGVYSRMARIMWPTWTLLSGLRNWAAVKVNVRRPNWRLLGAVFFLMTPWEFIEDTHRTRSCRAYVKQMHIGLKRLLYLIQKVLHAKYYTSISMPTVFMSISTSLFSSFKYNFLCKEICPVALLQYDMNILKWVHYCEMQLWQQTYRSYIAWEKR